MADEFRRFHIQQCLGSGGFGEVYLARMVSPGGVESEVAVKVLHEGLDPRSQAVQRLRDEGRLLGSLNHPAVLKVRDLVMLESRVALVMEYVPGLDLEGCFDSSPVLPMRAGVEVCARVADALKSAYETLGPNGVPLKLVHRDIKPSNIRVGKHGDVKLLDFGIAKASDARREAKTQTRVTIGSPWYMAPERFDRISDDPASDVYALGCSLFEVASGGRRLFEDIGARDHFLLAVDPARHDAHVAAHFDPLAWEPSVRAMLERMLAFERTERPSTHDLGPMLEDLAEELPGLSLRKWVREVKWPEPPSEDGALVGKVITEHRISHIVSEGTPVPSKPREPAGALEGMAILGVAGSGSSLDGGGLLSPSGDAAGDTLAFDETSEEMPATSDAVAPASQPRPIEPFEPPKPVVRAHTPPPPPPIKPPAKRKGGSPANPVGWAVGIVGLTVVAVVAGLGLLLAYFLFTLLLFTGINEATDTGPAAEPIDFEF